MAAREQGRDHLEGGIFRGGADEDHRAAFHIGQKGVLLRFVEAVDLVDEDDGALVVAFVGVGGILHHGLDVADAGKDGAELDEAVAGTAFDDAGDGGFPGSGRAPEDERVIFPGGDHLAQQGVFGHQLGLAAKVFQAGGTEPLGQGGVAPVLFRLSQEVGLIAVHRQSFRNP